MLFSYGSHSIPSPFHLSWLCLVEYLDLFTDEEASILLIKCFSFLILDDLLINNFFVLAKLQFLII